MPKSATGKSQKPSRKEAFRQQRRRQQQRERIIIISVVSVVVLVIAAILIVPNLPVNIDNFTRPEPVVRNQVDGLTLGDPNAPVKIEEFADFKCVACADFWENQEPTLLENYINTGKVYYKYVPMSFLSQESFTAAEAAYCAMDQGKFWEYQDYIFANFGTTLSDPLLRAFAQDLDLNMSDFDNCYKQGKYRQQVQDDLAYAREKGVNATPTFELNGSLVDRGSLFDQIDQLLSE